MGRDFRPGTGLTGRVNRPRLIKNGVCVAHGDKFLKIHYRMYLGERKPVITCTVCHGARNTATYEAEKAEYREGLDIKMTDEGIAPNQLVKIPLVCGHDTLFQMRHLPKWSEILYCQRCEDYVGQERARARVPSL